MSQPPGRRMPRPKLDLPPLRETIPEVLKNGALGYICVSGRILSVPENLLYGGERIGNGEGQSAVYRLIYNGKLIARKDVAVRLPKGVDQDSTNKLMAKKLREVNVINGCAPCPFIVHFFGYYVHKYRDCVKIHIFMEEMALSASVLKTEALKQGGAIPEFVIGRIVCSVIHAMWFLKDRLQIIHRDIKPGNILIDYDGRVKICDFGICGILENSIAVSDTGCQQYTAPEILVKGVSNSPGYSIKSDIWSLGITIFELATLRYPYPVGFSEFTLLSAIVTTPAPYLERGTYSDSLVEFVSKLLQIKEADRPSIVAVKDLQFFLNNDTPFLCIGTGVGDSDNILNERPSVGAWLDDLFFSTV
ncbi:mitogen-activated protein kinase kinase [Caenorhabditis elegans]|uniref:mitogen-activated protein kinase kinase n=1 Tax=Caenorhabditis elegans TaxID=6239 RepID=Q58AU7_CAEEL|nr:Protein kinase domain-containing protein [Caenorhabditis elegans]CCD62792.1 Protein kinase domain-containing protein [Caenorhabditis elegans]|eukprot:NP_508916.3 SAPK/ERK kinase [Caenorhabditis elegans]